MLTTIVPGYRSIIADVCRQPRCGYDNMISQCYFEGYRFIVPNVGNEEYERNTYPFHVTRVYCTFLIFSTNSYSYSVALGNTRIISSPSPGNYVYEDNVLY